MPEHVYEFVVYAWLAVLSFFTIASFIYAYWLWELRSTHAAYTALSFTVLCAGVVLALSVCSLAPLVQRGACGDVCVCTAALFLIWIVALFPIFDWRRKTQVEHM